MQKLTHFGLYHHGVGSLHKPVQHYFEIRAGSDGKFERQNKIVLGLNIPCEIPKKVAERKIPPHYVGEVNKAAEKLVEGLVGAALYATHKDGEKLVAVSVDYSPKQLLDWLNLQEKTERSVEQARRIQAGETPMSVQELIFGPRRAPGLGYYLDWLMACHLEKLGVTHVSTSNRPGDKRQGQVKKVGLPIGEPVPIRVWKRKMLAGYRVSRGKAK